MAQSEPRRREGLFTGLSANTLKLTIASLFSDPDATFAVVGIVALLLLVAPDRRSA